MDFEERRQQKRRQFIKVVIAEIGMVVSVILIVVVAVLASMGFFVSSNGTIEQNGMIQIHSLPTGASVELDGSVLFSRTNLSRTLIGGEHSLKIYRDGYDTWQKNIKMYSGMLVRLYYPRLFLEGRTSETMLSLGKDLEFYSPSVDYTGILYAEKLSPKWQLINIKGDEAKVAELDLTKVLPGVTDGKFVGKVLSVRWNQNGDQVLAKVAYDNRTEWILVNLRDVARSLNVTKTFGLNFDQIEMIDDAASQLYALENHHLRKITTGDQAISRVLLDNVQSFANEGINVAFVMLRDDNAKKQQAVGVYRDGDKAGTIFTIAEATDKVHVALAKYYDMTYLAFSVNDKMSVYYGTLPAYNENASETDFSGLKSLLQDAKLVVTPDKISVSPQQYYVVAQKDKHFMVVDFEMEELTEYDAESANLFWLDDSMMNAVVGDELKVWDFDHTNQRVLVKDEKLVDDTSEVARVTTLSKNALANYPAVISDNNRWLYYVVYTNNGLSLQREKIRD